jgi:hypothetical protein
MQMLLAQFSQANSKLAVENDKLCIGRQELANDHADVLNEIEYLRNRLNLLEDATSGGNSHTLSTSHTVRRVSNGVSIASGHSDDSRRLVDHLRYETAASASRYHKIVH